MKRLPGSTLVELIISMMLAGFVLAAIQFTLGVAMNLTNRSEKERTTYDTHYLAALKLREVLFNHELKESGDSVLLIKDEQVQGWVLPARAILILKTGASEADTIVVLSGQHGSAGISGPVLK